MLLYNSQLTEQELVEVEALIRKCRKQDSNQIPVYSQLLSQFRPGAMNWLYYRENELFAFLSHFFFDDTTCEVALMVSPEHRGKGIARELLLQTSHERVVQGAKTLVFSSLPALAGYLRDHHFNYLYSEHELYKTVISQTSVLKPLTLRTAGDADLDFLCAIDRLCFPEEKKEMSRRFHSLLHSSVYTVLVASVADEPVGKAHVLKQNNELHISDIAIFPDIQNQGFGTALLSACLNYAFTHQYHQVVLKVKTSNQNALKLYTNLGFSINNTCDYWAIPASEFNRIISSA